MSAPNLDPSGPQMDKQTPLRLILGKQPPEVSDRNWEGGRNIITETLVAAFKNKGQEGVQEIFWKHKVLESIIQEK